MKLHVTVSGEVYFFTVRAKEIETEGCNGCSSLQNCSSGVKHHSFGLL